MARKSLRPQLNQIRAWVRQGRTDAWIAHQLEVSASQLQDFRSATGSTPRARSRPSDVDLRDEIEAEIEAELDEVAEPEEEDEDGRRTRTRRRGRGPRSAEAPPPAPAAGGAGAKPQGAELEATFDHGEKDGYGLWLDPAVKDDPVYAEHWAEAPRAQGHDRARPDRARAADDASGDDD